MASTKFATEALAKKNERSEADAIWTSMLVGFPLLLLSSIVLFFAARPFLKFVVKLPVAQQDPATLALRIGILTILAVVAGSVFNTPQLTRLRLRLNSSIELGAALFQSCMILIVLAWGGGLITIVAVGALSAIGTAAVHMIASGRLCPALWKPKIDRNLLKPLLKFGLGAMAVVLLGTLVGQGEKLLLVRWGSTTNLAYYNIAMTIAGLLVLSLSALAQPLMPSFVHLMSTGQTERLEKLYNNILTGVLIILMPCALVICITASPFLDSWAGADFGRESVIPLYILVAGNVLKALSMVPGSLVMSAGRIDLLPKFQAVELIPYGLLLFFFMARFGIKGAAIAWSLRAAAECLFLLRSARRVGGIKPKILPGKLTLFAISFAVLISPSIAVHILNAHPLVVLAVMMFSVSGYSAMVFFWIARADQRAWVVESARNLWR